MSRRTSRLWAILCLALFTCVATPQDEGVFVPGQKAKRPYSQVITPDFQTQTGVFKTHIKADKLYFEIPKDALGKEFVWVAEVRKTPAGGYGGTPVNDRIVRWEQRGEKVLLRTVNYSIRATEGGAIQVGVDAANVAPIVMAFDIETMAEDGSPVIDVTRLFKSDLPEFSVRNALGVGGLDENRSFIEAVYAFPTNVNVLSLQTFRENSSGPQPNPSNTAQVHHSICLLPEKPMMGRLFDSRVGYFGVSFKDYGTPEHRAADRQFISRFRLVKRNPRAALSDPVQPIVFYLSREVPEKWRPYIKQGVEDWRPAFAKAGFSNAIYALDAPSFEDDPSWSAEDARINVIRWAPSTIENARGPHIADPRTGETLSAHIIIWHNILNLLTAWYFVQASPNDPQAQKLPLPDALMGRILRYVVSHEVGHTLGLQHNFKASSSYSIQQLRSPVFTAKYGTEASIMDYGRFNYVAQPGDKASLIPVLGPYDFFAIEWGYKPIPEAKNPADEKPALDGLAAKQVNNPMLRFANADAFGADPSQQIEDLGDDPVEATRLGILNLKRVMSYLLGATTKKGEPYDDLAEMYDRVWGQFNMELGHVLTAVGGVIGTDHHAGRGGAVYEMVSKERQKAALGLFNRELFKAPLWMVPQSIVGKLQAYGNTGRVLSAQNRVLSGLFSEARLSRMLEFEARYGAKAYAVSEMLLDLRHGIWSELSAKKPKMAHYRQQLQRLHIQQLITKASGNSEARALAIGELRSLLVAIRKAIPLAADRATGLHLDDIRRRIDLALNPKG